jgi:hypothetical protein
MKNKVKELLDTDWFYLSLLTAIVILFCNRILFTDQIIRAHDVLNGLSWGAKAAHDQPVWQYLQGLPGIFHADWDLLTGGGRTLEGGWNALGLLFHRYLIEHFFPFPTNIAWLAVLAMCWGAAGTFTFCRLIGVGRVGSLIAALIYVLGTENISLINAGHIQKLESICWFPWVLLCFEKALRSGRLFHYALTALVLALQFFHMHWQISFYSCLALGSYWVFHAGARFLTGKGSYGKPFGKDLLLAAFMVALFFSIIAMSFAPLYHWSQQSERGAALTGTTAGSTDSGNGIGYEAGMGWSLPPEEILTYWVPGLFGFSRQEDGDAPSDQTFYWGRMEISQTGDYLGLLPWFLIPLPLLLRRDRYTWFFSFLMGATLLMALGKYTLVYPFMFEHLPAFSKFRVPKMILFLFAFAVAVLAGRGLDQLTRGEVDGKKLKLWLGWCAGLLALLGLLWIGLELGKENVVNLLSDSIGLPTKLQAGPELIAERYGFMLREAAIACGLAFGYAAAVLAWHQRWLPSRYLAPVLGILLLGDLWRVSDKFLVVTAPPEAVQSSQKNEVATFLESRLGNYRMQPMNGEVPRYYAGYGFANIFAEITVNERRYKDYLDAFSLTSTMPDLMNLKYLLLGAADYQVKKEGLAGHFEPVLRTSDGSVLLENSKVLPKAWLVPSIALVSDPQERVRIMNGDRNFSPALAAIIESPPPLVLAPFGTLASAGSTRLDSYQANDIKVSAAATSNALLVLGEKYYPGWQATVDGREAQIYPVDHILRGVYLTPGMHTVEFVFDPLPFKVGKYISLASFVFLAGFFLREFRLRRVQKKVSC